MNMNVIDSVISNAVAVSFRGLHKKYDRLFANNLHNELEAYPTIQNLPCFVEQAVSKEPPHLESKIWHCGLGGFVESFVDHNDDLNKMAAELLMIKHYYRGKPDGWGDDFSYLYFLLYKTAWDLFVAGKIVSVIQDGGKYYPLSWSECVEGLSSAPSVHALLCNEISVNGEVAGFFDSCDDLFPNNLGADKIWFALAHELPFYDEFIEAEKIELDSAKNNPKDGTLSGDKPPQDKDVVTALKAVESGTDKKARKTDVIAVLCQVMGYSGKEADRIWYNAKLSRWGKSGAPKGGAIMDSSAFKAAFHAELSK